MAQIGGSQPKVISTEDFESIEDLRKDMALEPIIDEKEFNEQEEKENCKDINEFGLSPKQERFANAYVFTCDFNARMAAEVAGYKNKSRTNKINTAKNLANNPKIKKRIKQLITQRDEMVVVDKHWILKKLKEIVTENEGKASYQLKALELLGSYLKLWKDNSNQSDESGVNASQLMAETFAKRKELMSKTDNILSQVEVRDNV